MQNKILNTIHKTILILSLIFTSCSSLFSDQKLPVKTLTITRADGTTATVSAEIAEKEKDLDKGFMNRKDIPDGTGMLFIFKKDQVLSFWMKNTPHPLSIAYIDSKGKIRDIFDMKPYSLAPITSTVSVRYALEVPQGWFKKNDIDVGDIVSWE
jgi:uncharacterized ACR, COG1430